MTASNLKTIFENYLVLLECHNEQKHHIAEYFKSKNIRVLSYPFFTADYSFMIMPNSIMRNQSPAFFGHKFLIERKSGAVENGGGFAEMKNNLAGGHKQFKAEFERMKNVDNVFLLIENAENHKDILKTKEYKMPQETFVKIFTKFLKNRNADRSKNIKVIYSSTGNSGETVMKLIYNFLKKTL